MTVYTYRFLERDFQGAPMTLSASRAMTLDGREPEPVFSLSQTLGPPEIVHGEDGFLVLVHGDERSLYAVPLDRNGRVNINHAKNNLDRYFLTVSKTDTGQRLGVVHIEHANSEPVIPRWAMNLRGGGIRAAVKPAARTLR